MHEDCITEDAHVEMVQTFITVQVMYIIYDFYFFIVNIIFQHHEDPAIGVHVIDRYTYYVLQFLEGVTPNSKATVGELVSSLKQFKLFFDL